MLFPWHWNIKGKDKKYSNDWAWSSPYLDFFGHNSVNYTKSHSRLSQHHRQSVLLDSGRSVEPHLVDALQQLGFPIDDNQIRKTGQACKDVRGHVLLEANPQAQLLESFHRVERGGGVPLQDLHLVPVADQGPADEFIEQWLLRQVHTVLLSTTASMFSLVLH